MNQLAQLRIGNFRGWGRYATPAGNEASLFASLLSGIIGIMTAIAFIWFTFQFFIGAIEWISAGSDKTSVEGARKKLTTAIIGLVVVISAIFIIDFIGTLLNIPILDIEGLIVTLSSP